MVIEVVTIDVDRLFRPHSLEAQLAPGADILFRAARGRRVPLVTNSAAGTLRAEDAVELLDGEVGERIVLVDENCKRERPAGDIIRAGGHRDFQRQRIEHTLVRLQLIRGCTPAHRGDVGAVRI